MCDPGRWDPFYRSVQDDHAPTYTSTSQHKVVTHATVNTAGSVERMSLGGISWKEGGGGGEIKLIASYIRHNDCVSLAGCPLYE